MAKKAQHITEYLPNILLVGVNAPYNKTPNIDSYFEEFLNLIKTNGVQCKNKTFIRLRSIDSSYFFTKGKLHDLKQLCEEQDIDEVIISEQLTPQQERNLNDFLNCKIFDRTHLILEIFEKAAHSAEGKTQVEIAMLKHLKTRLAGKGVHLSQQAGIIGGRGPGETLKERETRHIDTNILKLQKQLKKNQQNRAIQRKRRLDNCVPLVCLIGYTNAGKSTIMNALTKSDVLAQDKLFATLDTTTRELYVNGQKKGLLSDTVGFIQQLPHQLIEAFKSTLSELQYADLLIHVIDVSDENWQAHIKVVHKILDDLGVFKDMVYVFNKADKANLENPALLEALEDYQPHVVTSALSKDSIKPLVEFLAHWQKK